MDELLAQELGIGGADATSYLDAQGNAPAPVPQEMPPQDFGGLTEDDVLAMFAPGYQSQQPASAPQPAAPEQLVDAAPLQSVAAKESGKGFSQEKHAQLSSKKGPEGDYRRNQAAIAENAGDQFSNISHLFDTARDLESQAIDNETQAQIGYDTEKAVQSGILAQHQRETATKSAEIQAKWAGAIAQSRADYVVALNEFRASKVNPSQFYDNLSGGEKIGLLATAFVHDFLGAKGIKTSAMDTINRAIDRNINAQIENIKNKGQAAEMFRTVWDMQRAESSSESEAFVRMRGFMLEALGQEAEQHLNQFKTGVTAAKGEALKAKLEAEKAKNLFEVYKYVDSSKNSQMQQELSWQVAKMQNAQQAYANSIAARRLDLDQKKAEREEKAAAKQRFLIDGETNKPIGIFIDEAKPEDVRNVKDRMAALEGANKKMERIRELVRKVPAKPDGTPGRLEGEDARELEALRLQYAHSALAAMGERATNEDVQDYLKAIPRDTWLTSGGVERIVAGTHKQMLESVDGYVRQWTVKPGQADQSTGGNDSQAYKATRTDAALVNSGEANRLDQNQKINKNAAKMVAGPASSKIVETEIGTNTGHDTQQFREQYPEQAAVLAKEVREKNGGHDGIPAAQVGMSTLATQASMGVIEARKKLESYADSWLRHTPGSDNDWRGAYAAMLLDKIDGNVAPDPNAPQVGGMSQYHDPEKFYETARSIPAGK